jgi:hypothetical protein
MFDIPFLDPLITKELILKPEEVMSTPFPSTGIPEILASSFFVVEECEEHYYVRHIYNSYFCLPTEEVVIELELMRPTSDRPESEYQLKTVSIECLVANFSGINRTLAYVTDMERRGFLKIFSTKLKFEELPVELRNLYQAANMSKREYLKFNDTEIRTPHMARVMDMALGRKFW